jgi:hypothetical protein
LTVFSIQSFLAPSVFLRQRPEACNQKGSAEHQCWYFASLKKHSLRGWGFFEDDITQSSGFCHKNARAIKSSKTTCYLVALGNPNWRDFGCWFKLRLRKQDGVLAVLMTMRDTLMAAMLEI